MTLLLNLLVMGLKAVVGFLTGSLSLQADALHSATNSANNVLGLIANRFSSPRPDRNRPLASILNRPLNPPILGEFESNSPQSWRVMRAEFDFCKRSNEKFLFLLPSIAIAG